MLATGGPETTANNFKHVAQDQFSTKVFPMKRYIN
ncbi:hypothetical protein Tph_c20700 [Thermacetogenium phaeum DSM 12270]|jgi:hypothetical protein|uniref:Uncharacterized protein n=1 Tax=Thermacetogenium phaeum (strain ATCC BAA-254 / DSM 26808 / PB) TaxID=1089553 RepID=K4LW83_THEPS|nr:hypothetical protein Tph_c20700 [Thermacetogenium phaeum DSM 12270]